MSTAMERRLSRLVDVSMRLEKPTGRRPKIIGHAAVFDQWADLGKFQEVVRSGAFARHLATRPDVLALGNHDSNIILGRTKNRTLRLVEDSHGLLAEITPPDTRAAGDVLELIRAGYVNGMSFAFIVPDPQGERWDIRTARRELLGVRLLDVSVVTYPAYAGTSVTVGKGA
jgi:uncharacterized protein